MCTFIPLQLSEHAISQLAGGFVIDPFVMFVHNVYRANWVKVSGTEYRTPFALVVGHDDGSNQDLKFVQFMLTVWLCCLNSYQWLLKNFMFTLIRTLYHHHLLQKDILF